MSRRVRTAIASMAFFALMPMHAALAAQYDYVALTEAPAAGVQGSVRAGSLTWQCRGNRCTISGPWPEPGVAACRMLAGEVGRIKSYGHSAARLSAAQLNECNATLIAAPAPKAMSPGAKQAAPGVGAKTIPQSRQAPGGSQSTSMNRSTKPATVVPGGKLGAATPQTPRALSVAPPRAVTAMAQRPLIQNVYLDTGSCARESLTVSGLNFGERAGSHRLMFMTPSTRTFVRATWSFYRWNDRRIDARLPESTYVRPGESYVVVIVDERNNILGNPSREFRICPSHFAVSGDIRVTNCVAGPRNVRITAHSRGALVGSTLARGVPGDDFAMRYELRLPAAATDTVELRPALTGISCTGGSWLPGSASARLSYEQEQATVPFEYRVGVETRRIPMGVVSALVETAFRGTQIRINNYDPDTQRVRENDSYVRLSEALGGSERRFNIGPAVTGPRKYYINDINLSAIRVAPAGSELRVSLDFERNSTELKGSCGQDGFDAGCIAGAPDVEVDLSVDVYFTLARYYSRTAPVSLSFSRVRVVANVNAQADGLCLAFDFLCSAINDYRRLIRETIERSFTNVLDTRGVRDEIAVALRPALRDLRIGTLNAVSIEGNDLVLAYLTDIE